MKTLFAGPFVGEFGFELFEWQGYLRKISKNYDKIVIASRPKNEILYKDFANIFVPMEITSKRCAGLTNYDYKYMEKLHEKYNPTDFIYIDNELDLKEKFKNVQQEFVVYGNKKEKYNVDILIHARMILSMNDSYKISRNWPKEKWEILVKKLKNEGFSIGSIGMSGYCEYLEGTENFIDLNLSDLSDLLASSKMIIGPSSGPMHFATLCKCPQFVWTSDQVGIGLGNKYNYEKRWNPFGTKVFVHEDGGWNPEVDDVYNNILNFYNEIK